MNNEEEWDWFEEVEDREPRDPMLSAVLRAVRQAGDEWSSLGIPPEATIARLDDNGLRVFIDVLDKDDDVLATLRVDVKRDGTSVMAWSDGELAEVEERMEDTDPLDIARFSSPIPEELASHVVAWLDGQLRRVVVRYEWSVRGRIRATCEAFQDTGTVLASSGAKPHGGLDTADRKTQIRP
ncbi:hypothetical protein [Actinoallomurus sp. CA-142502]|uniref:hypothetical protein n=1 Tax=Actinoallomurus sp. CA-142502 TaxID=3239885 RepID=UPI003D8E40FB